MPGIENVFDMDHDFKGYKCPNCNNSFAVKKGLIGYAGTFGCPYCGRRVSPIDKHMELKGLMQGVVDELHGLLGEKLLGVDQSRGLYNQLLGACQRLTELIHRI